MAKLNNTTIYGSANVLGNVVTIGPTFDISSNGGINLSNANSISSVVITNSGANYISIPTITFSNTTTGGVTANANVLIRFAFQSGYVAGNVGVGYANGDYLYANNANALTNAVFQVTSNTATTYGTGGINGLSLINAGLYFTVPYYTNSAGVANTGTPYYITINGTSGTGTGANVNISATSSFIVNNVYFSNYGAGYVEQPTVTFSGGSPGTAATGYATVGTGTNVKFLGGGIGTSATFSTPSGPALIFSDGGVSTPSALVIKNGANPQLIPALNNADLYLSSTGTGSVRFYTNSVSYTQLLVTPTISAVNFLAVTGSVTSSGYGGPVIYAAGSDANISLVLQPKGLGSLQAQPGDNTTANGGPRGNNAVDFQTSRTNSTQVASGTWSVIVGGQQNSALTQGSFVGGGYNNYASGSGSGYNTIAGGYQNNISGSPAYGFIGGGQFNNVGQPWGITVGGSNNTSAGYYNFIGGGYYNSGTSSAAANTQSVTINANTIVNLSGANTNIRVGQLVIGTNINPATYITAVNSTTNVSISQAASSSGTTTASFFVPHGIVVGGGNNTANGSYSFVGGGGDASTVANGNKATGDWSVIGGGWGNYIGPTAHGSVIAGGGYSYGSNPPSVAGNQIGSAPGSFIGGGVGHNIVGTSSGSAIVGGESHQIGSNSTKAFIGTGRLNLIQSAGYSSIINGYGVIDRGVLGAQAYNSGIYFSSRGDTQATSYVLFTTTTTATVTELATVGSPSSTTIPIVQAPNGSTSNNTVSTFHGIISARDANSAAAAGWEIKGVIQRTGSATSTTALVGSPTILLLGANSQATANGWGVTGNVTVTADTTYGGISVNVQGPAANTIRWVCRLDTADVS